MPSGKRRRKVTIGDPYGLHARNTASLLALLRKCSPGTRLTLGRVGASREHMDLGDVTSITPMACFRQNIRHGEELVVVATGPQAEYVLDSVEYALSEARGRGMASREEDWLDLWETAGSFKEADGLMDEVDSAHVAYWIGMLP